jgi:hypothetical protein
MTNSFYYFFSSTPQVLGGVLALFGVFVIFKIQSSRSLLLGIAQTIIDDSSNFYRMDPVNFRLISDRLTITTVIQELQKAIQKGDMKEIINTVKFIDNVNFTSLKERYITTYHSLKSLIRSTIIWSIFTATVIVICLSIIPFEGYILNHTCILYTLFYLVILFVIGCFIGLISILISALKE